MKLYTPALLPSVALSAQLGRLYAVTSTVVITYCDPATKTNSAATGVSTIYYSGCAHATDSTIYYSGCGNANATSVPYSTGTVPLANSTTSTYDPGTSSASVGTSSRSRNATSVRSTGTSSRRIFPTGTSSRRILPTGTSSRRILPTGTSSRRILPTGTSSRRILPTGTSSRRILPTNPTSRRILPTFPTSRRILPTGTLPIPLPTGTSPPLARLERGRIASGFVYIGCFIDDPSISRPALIGPKIQSLNYMTPSACSNFCNRESVRLAATKNGQYCTCADSIEERSARTDDANCGYVEGARNLMGVRDASGGYGGVPCSGNSSLACGGKRFAALYANLPWDPESGAPRVDWWPIEGKKPRSPFEEREPRLDPEHIPGA